MLRSGVRTIRSISEFAKRFLYADVKPHSKISIESSSNTEICCLPKHEADRSAVIIPDASTFSVKDGWKIVQQKVVPQNTVSRIGVPAHRGMYIFSSPTLELQISQKSDNPLKFLSYEGPKTSIESNGPVAYSKLKVPFIFGLTALRLQIFLSSPKAMLRVPDTSKETWILQQMG